MDVRRNKLSWPCIEQDRANEWEEMNTMRDFQLVFLKGKHFSVRTATAFPEPKATATETVDDNKAKRSETFTRTRQLTAPFPMN